MDGSRSPGLWTFLRWEWTLQARTPRSRFSLGLYLLLVPAPAVALTLAGERLFGAAPGPASYLVWTQQFQILLSVLLGCAWAGNRSGRSGRDEMWPVLSASPLSNVGYGLRRAAALALLLLPATALGTLAAASAAFAVGETHASPMRWLLVWLLMVYVPAAVATAAWLTLVSASGSEMVAAVLALVVLQVGFALNSLGSTYLGRPLGLSADFLGLERFRWAVYLLTYVVKDRRSGDWFSGIASEAPVDPALFLTHWWVAFGVSLSSALALGLLMPLWLGRTKRDLPPLRLSQDHWLRTLGPKLYGFLQRLVPDAGLRGLPWLLLLALVPVLVASVNDARRAGWVLGLAQERFDAEQAGADLVPTGPGLRMMSWGSEGTVSEEGVDLAWQAEFSVGEPAASHFAFTLDPFLELRDLRVVELGGPTGTDLTGVTQRRLWDRWLVDIEPPLRPGQRIRLSAHLRGRPGRMDFPFRQQYRVESFATLFQQYQKRGFTWRYSDPADSLFLPAVSAVGVNLRGESLGPVPRYSTWELTPPPDTPRDRGWEVPNEVAGVAVDVSLDLLFHSGNGPNADLGFREPALTVASSCGGLSSAEDLDRGRTRLLDSCRLPVNELRLLGSRWQILGEPPVRAAALPRHRDRLEALLPELRRTVAASGEAWPGYGGIDRLAVVEAPAGLDISGRGLLSGWDWRPRPATFGRMVTFEEHHLLAEGLLDPAAVLDDILGADVATSRYMDPDQMYGMQAFLAGLMKRRMGVATPSAVVGHGLPIWKVEQLRVPIARLRFFHDLALAQKVPAVVLQLERRLGMEPLVSAVSEFLAQNPEKPATFEELLEVLELRTGEDLSSFFHDYFDSGSLPELKLVDVRSLPHRGGWEVTGAVQNLATGSVNCPVVLRTDGPELRRNFDVPAKGRVEFSFEVDSAPQVAILDPDGLCLRLSGGGGTGGERATLQR